MEMGASALVSLLLLCTAASLVSAGTECIRFGKRHATPNGDPDGLRTDDYVKDQIGRYPSAPDGAMQCFKIPFPASCSRYNHHYQNAQKEGKRFMCCQVQDTGLILPSWKCVKQGGYLNRDQCGTCFSMTTDYEAGKK